MMRLISAASAAGSGSPTRSSDCRTRVDLRGERLKLDFLDQWELFGQGGEGEGK